MEIVNFVQKFAHKREMAESMDEILIGQIIAAMAERGYPVIGIRSDADYQQVRFRTPGDPVLFSVIVALNRLTGGLAAAVVGNRATLTVTSEVKNYLADPDDLLAMYRTDLQNLLKIPLLSGGIKLNHQFNSVFATTTRLVEIGQLSKPGGYHELARILGEAVDQERESLRPYKKESTLAPA
ncbi:MAG TPA: hypothetical protein VNO81_00505 [Candidatus Nitrosotenuis sp.]|nr:hypothetical protein [Candidatus Nitrosotenuis sp.]